jgi:hypothetical protein
MQMPELDALRQSPTVTVIADAREVQQRVRASVAKAREGSAWFPSVANQPRPHVSGGVAFQVWREGSDLVFRRDADGWTVRVPMPPSTDLFWLDERDLDDLLRLAR